MLSTGDNVVAVKRPVEFELNGVEGEEKRSNKLAVAFSQPCFASSSSIAFMRASSLCAELIGDDTSAAA